MMKPLMLGAAFCALTTPALAETFVLVHGAFQTAADWQSVAEALTAAGHTAVTVDLPGRSGDGRPLGEVTMMDHVAAVLKSVVAAAAVDADGKVVLVGHSFGGLVISAVAEADAAPLAGLVYVAAYLPRIGTTPGDSLQDLAMTDHHGAWQADSFLPAADYSSASVNPRDRVAIFANDADAATAERIAAAMVDEPLAPLATPVPLTAERFGAVRKAYVVTLRDKAVSTDLQLTMIGRGMLDEVVPLDTGHVPQVTAPEALAVAIQRAATVEIE
jgi:alpha-beta hydrolase superfamily lysophospholipase